MTAHDTGVTELLRQASDGLTPDVDRLVSGGISRGRSRQRRARIGTTVASLAVIGVVGALAAVVPQVGGADSARDPGIATDGATATETTADPPAPATTERALAGFGARDVIATVNDIVGTDLGVDPRPMDMVFVDADDRVVYFPYDGTETAVGMGFNQLPTVARCNEMNTNIGGSCAALPDGTVQMTWGPRLADGVTCQGVSAYRYGYVVWANSCNAAKGKDSPPLMSQPPLSLDELAAIATSEVWFE